MVRLLLVTSLVFGCFTRYVYVYEKYPIISLPERPEITIPDDIDEPGAAIKLVDSLVKVATYSEQLEESIKEYNRFAREKNARGIQ